MYPWYGFLTDEAKQNQLSSMSELGSGDPIQKPRQVKMTAIDAIQLQKERLINQILEKPENIIIIIIIYKHHPLIYPRNTLILINTSRCTQVFALAICQ